MEYLGSTEVGPDVTMVGVGYAVALCDRLWHGHPGVISVPVSQHVLVAWVGLEEAVASFRRGIANVRPLALLPEPITDPYRLAHLNIRRHDRLAGILHEYDHAA